MDLDSIMTMAPVIPVLVVDDVAHARPLAEALVAGGLPILEVTLRTPVALDVITEMAKVPGAIVGAGTVISAGDLSAALVAGARFVVSPGITAALGSAARTSGVPFLPGVASASDIIRAQEMGFNRLKFFPAVASGGLPLLRALAAPFGHVRFCPTGGITPETAGQWLAEPSVVCVGGSWIAGRGETDWAAIEARARAAAALPR
ncbi:bifunctional 4-hydroxy-2-oxoglutarate aldolase/2-dehydro-3-deoxy-phosphogluconate aldolase [Sandarakinorhabdus sp. AAP62]|uniref:bifunctional 4-hydroxy-2-oxoglutarate aldolase/2-dehydro-3-deoxy-phosphogluconate aldolase n=1 Tax=Sandarakinorhabdus sp. AAP62 TaxID=1248916 RepID=UPI00031047E1|nr:bifunctional 4-hydroxy-2-oxoglutarate aldolase/2-dehydro-3-deoxy-phosphogluconate aldolase [Sandarakinorhabdus sp. AAP62]